MLAIPPGASIAASSQGVRHYQDLLVGMERPFMSGGMERPLMSAH